LDSVVSVDVGGNDGVGVALLHQLPVLKIEGNGGTHELRVDRLYFLCGDGGVGEVFVAVFDVRRTYERSEI
jgi:hypothetical protein